MISLGLGLIAAFAWGVHDVCVRYVSQRTGILPALFSVLLLGCVLAVPAGLWLSPGQMTPHELQRAALAGVTFAAAGFALYKAFEIGPVRLVAPVIGAYPALSVGWAALQGSPISLSQWAAIGVIILGVGFVAGTTTGAEQQGQKRAALGWSVLASVGFAASFALAHSATAVGTEFAVNAVSRLAAVISIAALALAMKTSLRPDFSQLKLLALMGALDGLALGAVVYAGNQAHPEFAPVAASCFGLVTVALAAILLKEPMRRAQWAGVCVVFAAIAYLAL